jgi:predicted MFS family arabinose efflux permease
MGMGMFGAITYIPLVSQAVIGTSASGSGYVLTPMMLSLIVSSIIGGRLITKPASQGYSLGFIVQPFTQISVRITKGGTTLKIHYGLLGLLFILLLSGCLNQHSPTPVQQTARGTIGGNYSSL